MVVIGRLSLCPPAFLYLLVSFIAFVIIAYQNIFNPNSYSYCIGNFNCEVPNIYMVYLVKLLYIFFWTWLINIICMKGGDAISWFLVILPFVLLTFFVGSKWAS